MARPRKVSDEQIFEAAFSVLQRRGPAEWTLADVAAEAGLTAGALVQRFGSKRALQVELIARFSDGVGERYDALRGTHATPLAAVRAYADQFACLAETPEGFAHHLDYLRLDLTDPEMHEHFKRHAEAARTFVRETLADAVRAGELRADTDTNVLARMVETAITGSLFTWATYREGLAAAWVLHDLDLVLAPWLFGGAVSSRREPT